MESSKRFSITEIDALFDKEWESILLKRRIENCELDLLTSGIIEYCNDNGFENTSCLQFTDRSIEVLFAELEITTPKSIIGKDIIQHTNIKTKKLFYNEREEKSINQLTNLFNKENLFAVLKNLENNGMRKGIICLFHGGPGTGKTETVYQLARKTERNIMLVDISESKSKWYGETEKKIKAIFDSYRAYIKEHREAPILLFNEADAIIGKRKDNSKDAVDRTENTVQNIILQEMETFEGIMIATTNLTQNIDKAFERRFLYKIEFDKPNVSVKERIWKTMLPILKKNERHELAQLYSFSGGEIENVVRKCTVENILNNKEVSFNSIREYCDSELLYKKVEMKKIGFR